MSGSDPEVDTGSAVNAKTAREGRFAAGDENQSREMITPASTPTTAPMTTARHGLSCT
ncbi:hypothetical protein IP91_03561 [Pseudoduganella lurida]|uniref:Uncharacterized protein n=1 Tax=Pseudoduganella lurida TaxID=1036180 RepID=A0A562R594_9BURK|nr:hypothetical protein IP91_03561 [Pseudoduganella lurida]